jgi:hypothetical protein
MAWRFQHVQRRVRELVGRDFKAFLRAGPSLDGLDLERSPDSGRDIDL